MSNTQVYNVPPLKDENKILETSNEILEVESLSSSKQE